MSDIPRARELLIQTLDDESGQLDRELIEEALTLLWRVPPVRKAAPTSRKMTPKLGEEIRTYASKNPKAAFQDIADKFDVNPGRVSEAMRKWRRK